jgi:Flp pilus assembly pilin Flp
MLKFYRATEALRRLRADQDGIVSFEYVVVAFCIVATVLVVFGTGSNSTISNALNQALSDVVSQLP